MIITLGGKAGSGKGTISKILAEKLGYEIISIGTLRRKLAEEMGLTILEFNRLGEKPENQKEFDIKFEDYQKSLDLDSNILLESRLGFLCQPDSFKVFLDVSDEIAAERIMGDNRTTDKYSDREAMLKATKERNEADKLRYLNLYGIDLRDINHYDFVVDTGDKTPDEIADLIISAFNNFKKEEKNIKIC